MNKIPLIATLALLMLSTNACGSKATAGTDAAVNETGQPAAAAPAPSKGAFTSPDLRAFGFVGKVKHAEGEYFNAIDGNADVLVAEEDQEVGQDSHMEFSFDADGRITIDPWGGDYKYNPDGSFKGSSYEPGSVKMKRDAEGRVVEYNYAKDEEDDNMFNNLFTYDAKGRLVKLELQMWEEQQTFEYFYEGDNIYPSRRTLKSMNEGEVTETETKYRYTKFDEQGNWLEREQRFIGASYEEGDEDGGTRWTGANIERRIIEYWE